MIVLALAMMTSGAAAPQPVFLKGHCKKEAAAPGTRTLQCDRAILSAGQRPMDVLVQFGDTSTPGSVFGFAGEVHGNVLRVEHMYAKPAARTAASGVCHIAYVGDEIGSITCEGTTGGVRLVANFRRDLP